MIPGSLYSVLKNVNMNVTEFSTDDLSHSVCFLLGKEEEVDEKK